MEKGKKPIYKKWWFWAIVIFLIFALFGGNSKKDNPPTKNNQMNSFNESITETSDSNSNKKTYTLTGENIGEYGKKVILNQNSDMPVEKYIYKIPAGSYKVTTTSNKISSFYIVKDEISHSGTETYPEELNYVGEGYLLTNGSSNLNGKAQKSVEITINEDESISIVSNDTFNFEEI